MRVSRMESCWRQYLQTFSTHQIRNAIYQKLLIGTLRNAKPTASTTFNDWPWKAGLLTWNRLPSTGVNHYRHHTNDSSMTLRLQTNRTFLTDRDWPITTDLRHLSLAGNNIAAKLTNQFVQAGIRTFDWQQLCAWLWWWLPLMLSKR